MTHPHSYKTIQLSQLRTFCQAATAENFTAAARALELSVPTVWQQVRALEEILKATLLRRRGRALELTEEGRLLLGLIQPHVQGLDSLLPLFMMRRAELAQPLTVASTSYLISYHLPQPVREFAKLLPSVRLQLESGLWSDMVRRVERGEANLGVVSYDREEPRSPSLEYEDLFELQFRLLTSQDHPLARKKRVGPRDLVEHPLILQSRKSYGYKILERLLLQEDLLGSMHVVMESPSTDSILKYVALGVGIALLYTGGAVSRHFPLVRARVFDPKLPGMPVAILTQASAHLPAPVEEFRRLLRRFLAGQSNDRHH